MPTWVQVVVGLAAFVTACGVLWTKVLHPGAKLVSTGEEMLPLLRQLTLVFKDSPYAFAVLSDIAMQFRTDSGSSLRDVVNRLDQAAAENKMAAEVLKVNVEVVKELAVQDRAQLARLLILLDRLDAKVSASQSGIARMEKGDAVVATDLAASQHRADEAIGNEGAAADAASRSEQ